MQGNDMLLRSSKAPDSVLLKDYAASPEAWRVKPAGSEEVQGLADVLAANYATLAAMELTPRMKQDFQDAWYAQETGKLSGWNDLGNDVFQSPVNFSVSYSESRDRGTLALYGNTTYVTNVGLVYSSPTGATIDTHPSALPPAFSAYAPVYYGTGFTLAQLGTLTINSDAALIESGSGSADVTGQTAGTWDVQVDWYQRQASQEQVNQSPFKGWIETEPSSYAWGVVSYTAMDYTDIRLLGTALSIAPSAASPGAIDGKSLVQQVWDSQAPQDQFALSLTKTDVSITHADIHAGSADDTIYLNAGDMVSAGEGDDVILGSNVYGRFYSGEGLGFFADAGAGNDQILGGYFDDVLIGGAGNDFVSGGMGSDIYALSAVDNGQDVVVDDGTRHEINEGSAWSGPSTDALVFGNGVALADLHLELGMLADADLLPTLELSWGDGNQARVALDPGGFSPEYQSFYRYGTKSPDWLEPGSLRGLGSGYGIEQLKFADGTVVGINDLLSQIGPLISQGYFYVESAGQVAHVQSLNSQRGGLDASGSDGLSILRGSTEPFGEVNGRDAMHAGGGDNLLLVRNLNGTDIFLQGTGRTNVLSYVLDQRIGSDFSYGHDVELLRSGDDLQINALNIEFGWDEATSSEVELRVAETVNLFTVKGWFLASEPSAVYLNGQYDMADLMRQFSSEEGGLIADRASVRLSGLDLMASSVDWDASGFLPELVAGILGAGEVLPLRDLGQPLARIRQGSNANDILDSADASGWTLLGLGGSDTLNGEQGNDVLDGGVGADRMAGGAGDDTYFVEDAGDQVIELSDEGVDRVYSVISYTLPKQVEALVLSGAGNIIAIGNTLDNVLIGNAGDNTLNGRAGADTMRGGLGNDVYRVDNVDDTVTEYEGEGTDRVIASITYVLGEHVENLSLTGPDVIDGTGNELDNQIKGNSASNMLFGGVGNDTLNGGAGADTLFGGFGDDDYVVDQMNDQVVELVDEGVDTVRSSVDFVLPDQVENLTLTGSAQSSGWGNALDNVLVGNADANYLAGLAGHDSVRGNGGNDILQGGFGDDLLHGNAGVNLLDGGVGDDVLTGGTESDLFIGGRGEDVITTNSGADVIVFNRGDGLDAVNASSEADNTLSLGGGLVYGQLSISRAGYDLVLDAGPGDQISFKNWYRGKRSISTLQMVLDGSADYLPDGADPARDNLVETFDFGGMVAAFDAAYAEDPALTAWSLSNALAEFHLSGSDIEALGGDLAYQYGKSGNLSNVGLMAAQSTLSDPEFGTAAQMLKPLASLQEGVVRLM
jgi:Ca2+-binding RTX toxin-like protein